MGRCFGCKSYTWIESDWDTHRQDGLCTQCNVYVLEHGDLPDSDDDDDVSELRFTQME